MNDLVERHGRTGGSHTLRDCRHRASRTKRTEHVSVDAFNGTPSKRFHDTSAPESSAPARIAAGSISPSSTSENLVRFSVPASIVRLPDRRSCRKPDCAARSAPRRSRHAREAGLAHVTQGPADICILHPVCHQQDALPCTYRGKRRDRVGPERAPCPVPRGRSRWQSDCAPVGRGEGLRRPGQLAGARRLRQIVENAAMREWKLLNLQMLFPPDLSRSSGRVARPEALRRADCG